MQPHANMGIRFRSKFKIYPKVRKATKDTKKSTPMSILALVAAMDNMSRKIPFWKMLYRQGRRG